MKSGCFSNQLQLLK